jgi:hypothetical protein
MLAGYSVKRRCSLRRRTTFAASWCGSRRNDGRTDHVPLLRRNEPFPGRRRIELIMNTGPPSLGLPRLSESFDKIEVLPASSAFEESQRAPSTDAAHLSRLPAGPGDRPDGGPYIVTLTILLKEVTRHKRAQDPCCGEPVRTDTDGPRSRHLLGRGVQCSALPWSKRDGNCARPG